MRPAPASAAGVVASVALALAACAPEATSLLRQDLDAVRADLDRLEHSIQTGHGELKADLQQADRRSARTLEEIQRSVARLGARLDELGRDLAQSQGRLDEVQRRLDALALRLDVAPSVLPAGSTAGAPAQAAQAQPPPEVAAAIRQATDIYRAAYLDYTRGNYHLAIMGFQEFVRRYPGADLADKALYWIGESHLSLGRDLRERGEQEAALGEFEQARLTFETVRGRYPQGDLAPASLYKEALAYLELGDAGRATATLQYLVDRYPHSEESSRAKEDLGKLRPR